MIPCSPTWAAGDTAAAVGITRTDLDAAGLRRAAGRSRDAAAARRMLALALVLDGASRADAAQAAGMDRQTLRDWVHRYNEEGLTGLSDRHGGGVRPLLSPAQEADVAGWVRQGPSLPEHARGRPLELWWQDEARIGQQGTLTRVWARLAKASVRRSRMEWQGKGERGSRPVAPGDQRYEWAYLFGAICPARGTGAALVLPTANAAMMNLHVLEISTAISAGAQAVLIVDGAGWHQTGEQLRVPDNITLLHLPPYSPELNPVENVWAYLRGNKLSNRVFATCNAIVNACCDAWNWLTAQPEPITSIGSRAWHRSLHKTARITVPVSVTVLRSIPPLLTA